MADDVGEMEDAAFAASKTDTRGRQSSRVSRHELSSARTSEPQSILKPEVAFVESPEVNVTSDDQAVSLEMSNGGDERMTNKNPVTPKIPKQPQSACRARSRDTQRCQKRFQEMIGKHEMRNDELEQREVDLRQRLNMLECSMPAVMSWNMWRIAQDAPGSNVRRLLQKQFQDCGDSTVVPKTPSKHYDCRVREIEAERKEALRRADEARVLLAEKEAAVKERRKLLEDARRSNQEKRDKMEKLNHEVAELRSALKNARGDEHSCETGECGEIRCRDKWLENVGSVSSIGSTDLECFAKLQELAEAEICMKRQITELERREEAYMRTLQQADEMWSKMEGDSADAVSSLQDQLGSKTAANQQLADRVCSLEDELEKARNRLTGCKDALSKFTDRTFSDVETGFANGEATVKDRGIIAAVRTTTASTVAIPMMADQETLALREGIDKESSFVPELADAASTASPKMFDKDTEAVVGHVERGVDRPTGLGIDAGVGDEESRLESALGGQKRSVFKSEDTGDENTPKHRDDWNWDEGCPPDAICDDMVESSTGTDDLQELAGVLTTESKVQALPKVVDRPFGEREAEYLPGIEPDAVSRLTDATLSAASLSAITEAKEVKKETHETVPLTDQIVLSREELRNWYNIVDSIHHVIAQCVNCSSKIDDTTQLAERMKLHLRIKGLVGVKGPTILEESTKPVAYTDSPELGDGSKSSALSDIQLSAQVKAEDVVGLVVEDIETFDEPASASEEMSEKSPAAEKVPEKPPAPEEISDEILLKTEMNAEPTDTLVDETSTAPIELSDELGEAHVGVKKSEADFGSSEERSTQPLSDSSDAAETKQPIVWERTSGEEGSNAEKSPAAEEISKEITEKIEITEDPTDILVDELSTDPIELTDELATTLLETKESEVESEGSEEPSPQPLEVATDTAETKQPVVSERTSGEKVKVDLNQDTPADETAISFVTPRTPPPSRMDVQFPGKAEDISDKGEQISDFNAESLIRSEELELAGDSSQQESLVQPTADVEGTAPPEIEGGTTKIRSPADESRVELLTDNIPAKISVKGLIAKVPEPSVVRKPSLSISTAKSVEKVKLPKSLDRCTCKPRTCPLLHNPASRESKPKAPKVFTEGTQTSSQMPKGLPERVDKLKLSTITESTWPSPEVGIWRRPMFWPRRPRDKSTLTTACVDIQTDSALVRGRTGLEEIDRKGRTTLTGVCPRYTEHGGCPEQISPQPQGPVGLAMAELFSGSVRFPASIASSIEKEIAVVKYDCRSLAPQESELHCVECGRPITPNGTPLSEKPSLSISSNSQNPIMSFVRRLRSSTSGVTGQKEECTCCDCKTSYDREVKGKDGSQKKWNAKKSSENIIPDKNDCQPCPADITESRSAKSSKISKKKKRRPEMKNQSVTADILKLKPLPMKAKNGHMASAAITGDSTISISPEISSKVLSCTLPVKTTSTINKLSKHSWDEDSFVHTSSEKPSSIHEGKTTEGENSKESIDNSSMDRNMSCNCSSIEDVSIKESRCNCAPLTQ